MQQIKLTRPSVTFGLGEMSVYLGTREVKLFTLPGHTGGDVLVYVPDANVIFTGDMGWSRTLPNLVDATVLDWIKSLDRILADHAGAKFIPGHGEVATGVEMHEFRDYLDDLRRTVQLAIDDKLTVEQAKTQFVLPDRYKSFAFQNFAQPNIEDMYKELTGTKIPIDRSRLWQCLHKPHGSGTLRQVFTRRHRDVRSNSGSGRQARSVSTGGEEDVDSPRQKKRLRRNRYAKDGPDPHSQVSYGSDQQANR